MLRLRNRFLIQTLCVVGLGVWLTPSCVRKTNPGTTGDACNSTEQCKSGQECVEGVCTGAFESSGGSASGGMTGSGEGGRGANAGSSTASGGAASGANSSGGSAGTTTTASGGSDSAQGGGGSSGASGSSGAAGASAGQGGAAAGAAPMGGDGGGGALETTLIDDMEDGDDRIIMADGRQGPWHTFSPNGSGELKPEAGGADDSMYAMHTKGGGVDYAGMSFDLNNPDTTSGSMQSKPFDASEYSGIVFMVKGGATDSVRLRVEVPTSDAVPTENGGTCTNSCWNVYGWEMPMPRPTSTWKEVKAPFASMVRSDGSKSPALDKSKLMSISFRQIEKANFEYWIDDVRFYK